MKVPYLPSMTDMTAARDEAYHKMCEELGVEYDQVKPYFEEYDKDLVRLAKRYQIGVGAAMSDLHRKIVHFADSLKKENENGSSE